MGDQSKSILSWVIIGIIAGGLASLMASGGGDTMYWMIAGLIGSVLAGFLAKQLNISLNFGNPFLERAVLAVIGAIIVLIIAQIII